MTQCPVAPGKKYLSVWMDENSVRKPCPVIDSDTPIVPISVEINLRLEADDKLLKKSREEI
jgi:hypothetical protein